LQIITGNFQNQLINDVSDQLLEAGELLKEISPEKRSCLTTFTKCFDLVTWLKESIKGKVQHCCTVGLFATRQVKLLKI
jgi:hypothetical protein